MTNSQQNHWAEGNKYATEGIKLLFALNGGAAIAVMTFIGQTNSRPNHYYWILFFFALGALVSGATFWLAYETQLLYGNNMQSKASCWHTATRVCALCSIGLFILGIITAVCGSSSLDSYGKKTTFSLSITFSN